MTTSGPSANTSATASSVRRADHHAPVLPAWRAHPAALSKPAISSAAWATVTGLASSPPSDLGVNMRKRPADRIASITGRVRRRSRSAISACSRMTGPSARARASRSLSLEVAGDMAGTSFASAYVVKQQPAGAESIAQHGEPIGEVGLLHLHEDLAAISQQLVDPLGIGFAVDREAQVRASHRFGGG